MSSTSISDVSSLFGGLNVNMQSMMTEKISTGFSANTSGSSNFQEVFTASRDSKEAAVQVQTAGGREKNPADEIKNTSDRIAGEEGSDARMTSGANEKQDKVVDADDARGADADSKKDEDITLSGDDKEVMTISDIENAEETLATLANDWFSQIIQILNIDPNKGQEILNELGMTEMDLLNTEALTAFTLEAMGAEDSLSLLTNESQYGQFQEIADALKELLASDSGVEDMNISELKALIDENLPKVENAGDAIASDNGADASLDAAADLPEAVALNIPDSLSGKNLNADNVNEEKDVKDSSQKNTAEAVQNTDEVSESEADSLTTDEGASLGSINQAKAGRRNQEENGKEQGQNQNPLTGNNQAANMSVDTEYVPETQAQNRYSDTQEIANQILDYMKAQVKDDMQTLELQLHPASLGTVQISLTKQAGGMTANFVAQNETVKAALETQMIQLQERFEEQGIKVTSIEVSVGTHSFEQNLEQQAHDEERREATQGPKKVRRLQLGPDFGMDDLDNLNDEERLAAEMLEASGGTVDYQA